MPEALRQPSSFQPLRALAGAAVVPACAAAAWLGLGSGAIFWGVVAVGSALVLGLLSGFGVPRGSGARLVALHAATGVVVALIAGALHAAAGGAGNVVPAVLQTVAFDVDAAVPLDPLPACGDELQAPTRLGIGANPRIDFEGRYVWYDAPGPEARRQIHRLPLEGGEPLCWTCGEPGHNRRPALNPRGPGLLFETDRDGSPAIHAMETRLRGERPRPSRRLTPGGGRSAAPRYEPTGRGLVWSHMASGRVSVEVASIVSGHGGLILGLARPVYAGGTAWVAPLAWAPDGRSLVVGRGSRPGPLQAAWIDPATGAERGLGMVPGLGAVDFSRDGRTLAMLRDDPTTGTAAPLGFLLARLPLGPVRSGTASTLWMGDPEGELAAVSLGELAGRRLVGLAVDPSAQGLVLAERDGDDDLLHRAHRRCEAPGQASAR